MSKRPTTDEADARLLADIAGAKAKHTPGPWCPFDNGNNTHNIISYGGGRTGLVGVTFSLPVSPEDNEEATEEANARLIAAAPDLLAACKEAKFLAAHGIGAVTLGEDEWSRANSDRNIGEIKRIMAIIDAAIAKAGGAA